jgi:hypothetical protein
MTNLFVRALGLLLLSFFLTSQASAQAPGGGGGSLIRYEPDRGFNTILVKVADTVVLTMQDFETLHIVGVGTKAIQILHTGVTESASSSDRWVMEQIDAAGNWLELDDHSCPGPVVDDRFNHPQGPFYTPHPDTGLYDLFLSNAFCTPGVREIMLIAH